MKKAVRGVLMSVVAWTAGGVAALGVGQVALAQLADGLAGSAFQSLTPDGPINDVAVPEPAASEPVGAESPGGTVAAPPGPTGSASPGSTTKSASARPPANGTSSGTYRDTTLSSPGGTVIVRCRDGQAYLLTWTPNPGYQAEEVHRGPAGRVDVKFASDRREVELSARCVGGIARAKVEAEESDE